MPVMLLASLPLEMASKAMSWAGYLVLGGIAYGGYKAFRLMKKKLGRLRQIQKVAQSPYRLAFSTSQGPIGWVTLSGASLS